MRLLRTFALWTLCLLLAVSVRSHEADAAASPWQVSGETAVRLVAAPDSVGAGAQDLSFGLEFKLEPGWKIYWRTPGDAGLPPEADWSGATNVKEVTWHWPAPERFMVLGLQTLGYEEHVVLPLTVALRRAGESVTLSGKLAYLACAELCVPHEAELSLTIPPGTGAAGPEAHLIERFRAVVPQPAQQAGIGFEALGWRLDGDTVLVQGRAKAPMGFSEPDVILEGPEGSFFDPPKMMVRGQTVLFELSGGGVRLEGEQPLPITLTLLDEGLAVEQSLMAAPGLETGSGSDFAAVSSRDEASSQTLMGVLLLALLGGLVLNLMPCVLPVLSLKLMAVLQPGRQDPSRMRLGFLVAAAGIITAFIGLAAGLAVVKAAGAVVGWGIQFQQPVFLVIMVAVMLLFAASLLGLFEVRLPAALMGRMAGGGQSGLSGDFASGLFATLLATPCSAPFVGTAVGFALTQGTSVILLVFAVMGIGLALPWLLAALFPTTVAALLPRPGPWIGWMKAILAAALGVAVLWLLSVLLAVAGQQVVLSVVILSVLAVVVLMVRRWLPETRLARFGGWLCAGLMLAAVAVPVVKQEERTPAPQAAAVGWQVFDEAAIPALVVAGNTVFVDVTADWCLTCIVNKKTVLEDPAVLSVFDRPNMVVMRADWTRPNADIARYLSRYGRYGIPFNIVYGPDQPEGFVLPELLTVDVVLEGLAQAGHRNPYRETIQKMQNDTVH